MGKLTLTQNGRTIREFGLEEKPLLVAGRALDCDMVIMDHLVSRKHAQFQRHGTGWRVVDLNSSNGVFVNNIRIRNHNLRHGDEVRIGHAVVAYQEEQGESRAQPRVTLNANAPATPGLSVVGKVSELRPEYAGASTSETMMGMVSSMRKRQQTSTGRLGSTRESFAFFVLFQLAQSVNSASTVFELFDKALELLTEALDAQCGAILLIDKKTGELVPKATRDRTGSADAEVRVSRTIADQVIRDKVAVLTRDALSDARFQHGQSIAAMKIRSAVCCPIWDAEEVDGIVYLVGSDAATYTEAERDLVTAVGHQLAVALRGEDMRRRLQEEAAMRANLERYHSPDVVEAILRGGGEVGLEVKEVETTILFVDIEGFTVLSNRLPPKDVATLLNGYFEGATEAIFSHRGQVNKYIGDAILAVFGAPIENPNHAVDAVDAALDMIEASNAFVATLPVEDRFRVRISLNSGPCVAGNIGTPQRMEYTVIGNTVNVASRLEKLAPPNGIAIGEETARLVGNQFILTALGPQSLKGVSRPIDVFVVEGRA